jgi:hypothetical protein
MTYVNSDNPAGSVSKQDIGESSRGGSNIQRALTNYIYFGKFI